MELPRVTIRDTARITIAVAIALIILWLLAAVFNTADESAETSDDIDAIRSAQNAAVETLEQVKSCTTPGRTCYERGQAETAEAVGSINAIAVYAAACADQPDTQTAEEIEMCVLERLSEADERDE